MLFEGGFTTSKQTSGGWGMELDQSDYEACGLQLVDNVLINDTGLGYTYNGGGIRDIRKSHQANGRFSTSWVKAEHSLKTGVQFMYGLGGGYRTYSTRNLTQLGGLPVSYQFNNGTPTQLTQFAAPIAQIAQLNPDLGIFVQDQWRMARASPRAWACGSTGCTRTRPRCARTRVRWSTPAASTSVKNLPNWKDLNPRMGVVWDPAGSGTDRDQGRAQSLRERDGRRHGEPARAGERRGRQHHALVDRHERQSPPRLRPAG